MGKRVDHGHEVREVKECCTARDVLWYLVFVGFAVNYMIRINLNLAIVAMVQPKPKDNISLTSECIQGELLKLESSNKNHSFFTELFKGDNSTTSFHDINNNTRYVMTNISVAESGSTPPPLVSLDQLLPLNSSLSRGLVDAYSNTSSSFEERVKFAWNEKVQSNILGSFFWLHWTTQVPGGLLANKYGTKLVFGLSNFAGVIFCCAIPYFAKMGPNHLMMLRLIQGILCGFAWPSMHNLTARWIPPNERSKFVTAYLGSSVGAAMTYPICGFIIDRWGWEYVFYACSAFGTLWFIAWWSLVHNSPSEHPRISVHEKQYILDSLGQSVAKEKAPVPWSDIFKDITVWMNILAQFGGLWGLFTLMTHAPTYFKFIHGWNIRATGVLSGMPHLLRMIWAYIFSQIGDYLLRSKRMCRSNVRKLATAVCCIGQAVFMMVLAYSGCNSLMAIASLTAAVAIHGSVSTGPLASVVDISPNYAAVLMGLLNTAAAFVGFITPAVVGSLTFQNQTTAQWQKVFWISSSFLFLSGMLYILFARSDLKSWNSPENTKTVPEKELMVIKTDKMLKKNEN